MEQAEHLDLSEEVKQQTGKLKSKEFKGKGLFSEGMPEEMEKRVDKRVRELIGEKQENQ